MHKSVDRSFMCVCDCAITAGMIACLTECWCFLLNSPQAHACTLKHMHMCPEGSSALTFMSKLPKAQDVHMVMHHT